MPRPVHRIRSRRAESQRPPQPEPLRREPEVEDNSPASPTAPTAAPSRGTFRSTFFGFRNVYEGAEVRRFVRRAKQFELVSEIDPDANFVAHGRFHIFAPVSLGVFAEDSHFRQFFVWLVTWAWWDRFSEWS